MLDVLLEDSKWYVLESGHLGQGVYRMANETISDTTDVIVKKDDKVRIHENNFVHNILGISVYEGTHMLSGKRVLFTANEIRR